MEGADVTQKPEVAAKKRLVWMDLLRGLAVIGMIETHVLNAFLDPSIENSFSWWHQLRFYNGLVAPAFLWIAGYVQGWMVRGYLNRGTAIISARRLRRLGQVALIGYLLHLPWPYWVRGEFSYESWRIFLQTDVLQCLAVSLVILLVSAAWFRRYWDAVVVGLTVLVLGLSLPLSHWSSGLLVVDTWLNRDSGSLFPLLPWFAFCAAGSLASRWQPQARWYVPLGLVLIFAGTHWRPEDFTSAHPLFFVERLGYLMIFIALVALISRWCAPAWLQLAGRESLLMYAGHLVIIYSLPITGLPLDQWIGKRLTLGACGGVFAALLAVCLGLAWLNERLKTRRKKERAVAAPAA